MKTTTNNFVKTLLIVIMLVTTALLTRSFGAHITVIASPSMATSYNECTDSIVFVTTCLSPEWDDGMGNHYIGNDTLIATLQNLGPQGSFTFICGADVVNLQIKLDIPLIVPQGTTSSCKISDTLHAHNVNPHGTTTYLWSTGSTSESVTVSAGTYTVTVSNLCGTVIGTLIRTYSNPDLVSITGPTSFCNGTSTTLVANANHASSYLWSTSGSSSALVVTTAGTYTVTATNTNGCNSTANVTVTENSTPHLEISLVTVETDSLSPLYGNNKVTWTVIPGVDSIKVLHLQGANKVKIGEVACSTGSFTSGENSDAHSYVYYIIPVSTTCGNGDTSLSVESIHSTISENPLDSTYNITWNTYNIGGSKAMSVSWYKLMGGNSLSSLHALDSVSGNSSTSITIGPNGYHKLLIGAELQSKGVGQLALSNASPNPVITGIPSIVDANTEITIYPNPTTDIITLAGVKGDYTTNVYDLTGRLILQVKDQNTINLGDFCSGIYIIKAITKNGVYTGKVTRQ